MDDSPRLSSKTSPADLREQLQEMVIRELLGPAGGETEEVEERHVTERYLVGLLAPINASNTTEKEEVLAVDGDDDIEEGPTETDLDQPTGFCPSSFGISCCIASEVGEILVRANWGHYTRHTHQYKTDKHGKLIKFWRREPQGGEHILRLKEGHLDSFQPDPRSPEVWVKGECHQRDNVWIVTLFLVNKQQIGHGTRNIDRFWLFQPELSVQSVEECQPIFTSHVPPAIIADILKPHDDEEAALAMRYRREIEFAVGHGVSVHVERDRERTDRAIRIVTRVVPEYEVGPTEAPRSTEITADGLVLDMYALATHRGDLQPLLQPLTTAYAGWITSQAERINDPTWNLGEHQTAAHQTIAACRTALERLLAGINLVAYDPQATAAFQFMNEAMWLQRIHTILTNAKRQGKADAVFADFDVPENRTWRPFQLAFILINLPGLTDLHHPDRSLDPTAIADLLWFPTGGGKTEAYLGLTAYTLGIRRLQGVIDGHAAEGVAVLMRYTLRLLTLQQFQRATALICACEIIRRRAMSDGSRQWGTTPFRLGLWVGQRTTPNTTDQSAESLRSDNEGRRGSTIGGSGTPAQLTNCPWCGAKIRSNDIKVSPFAQGSGRTIIYCGDELGQCSFSERQSPGEGLPALVVDEEIYRLLPALLIATVDKFAQMPWNGAVGMLFGQVNGICPRHGYQSPGLNNPCSTHPKAGQLPPAKVYSTLPLRPPDLIIQDELHLISGPLGTLVGLYEVAVDRIATWECNGQAVRPKVVASTATIRRANEQIRSLFTRDVQIFPPQGLDADDNFFARQRQPSKDKPGRRYIGICAPGHRLKSALIRVYVAHLAAAQKLYETYAVQSDPWMTLVGYFNTIRELAGMKRLIEDDVNTRLRVIDRRGLAKRYVNEPKELTSRRSGSDIPIILDQLETPFDPVLEERRKAEYKATNRSNIMRPIDVLLATNMISVGVDVKRLGLMVVAGQPKTTAEYIQATSRIGRTYPGLVCNVLNWTRPRDLSHYEHFEHYHATFYQQVEALSVTPFSSQARSRGLSALLVAMHRLSHIEHLANDQAQYFHPDTDDVQSLIADIMSRASTIIHDPSMADELRSEINERMAYWQHQSRRTEGGRTLSYRKGNQDTQVPLLHAPEPERWQTFTCLNSLRDVEPSANLLLIADGAMDLEEDRPFVRATLPDSEDLIDEDKDDDEEQVQ